MRLIDADELLGTSFYVSVNDDPIGDTIRCCRDAIRNAPTAYPLEGEWVRHYRTTMEGNPNYPDGWDCSRCGGLQYNRFPFCPACGSKNRRGK